jgi:hypothetical protein
MDLRRVRGEELGDRLFAEMTYCYKPQATSDQLLATNDRRLIPSPEPLTVTFCI